MTIELVSSHPSLAVHLIPASINHDGPANVSKYFKVSGTEEDDDDNKHGFSGIRATCRPKLGEGIMESSFRGRALYGQTLTIPKDHKGHLVEIDLLAMPSCGANEILLHPDPQEEGIEETAPNTPKEPPLIRAVGSFSDIHLWVPDEPTRIKDEPFAVAMQTVVQLADLIHGYDQ